MPRIEIWKGKPAWRAMSQAERQSMVHRLTELVKRDHHDSIQEDCGPYIIQKVEGTLLVWATDLGKVEAAAQYVSIGLDKYFEPLVHTSVTEKMNAKVLARKLSS